MKFSIKDLFSKCDPIHSFFYWKNPNFIFCGVKVIVQCKGM